MVLIKGSWIVGHEFRKKKWDTTYREVAWNYNSSSSKTDNPLEKKSNWSLGNKYQPNKSSNQEI